MHSTTPHQILGSVLLLVVKVVSVVVYLLLEEVEGLSAQSLAHQLQPQLVASVEHHEEPHGPEIVGLIIHLRLLPVESVLDNVHEVVASRVEELNTKLFQEQPDTQSASSNHVKILGGNLVLGLLDTFLGLIKVEICNLVERFLNNHVSVSDALHVLDNISSTKPGVSSWLGFLFGLLFMFFHSNSFSKSLLISIFLRSRSSKIS